MYIHGCAWAQIPRHDPRPRYCDFEPTSCLISPWHRPWHRHPAISRPWVNCVTVFAMQNTHCSITWSISARFSSSKCMVSYFKSPAPSKSPALLFNVLLTAQAFCMPTCARMCWPSLLNRTCQKSAGGGCNGNAIRLGSTAHGVRIALTRPLLILSGIFWGRY